MTVMFRKNRHEVNSKANSAFAISIKKREAINMFYQYSDPIAYHLIECVIYNDSLNKLDHWINEIANSLSLVNKYKIKPRNKKLKSSEYKNSVFASFGDSKEDAKSVLSVFKLDNLIRDDSYPDFEITDEMINCVYMTFQNVMNYVLPILTSNDDVIEQRFQVLVRKSIVFYSGVLFK